MVDLGQLEKLNDLREKGALTDEEFQAEKQRLFHLDKQRPKNPHYALIAALVIMALAFVIAAFLFTVNDVEQLPAAVPSPVATGVPTETVSDARSVAAEAETPQVGSYQWSVSPEIVGLNSAFVERKLGVAKQKFRTIWTFEVDGCEVTYWLKGPEIRSLSTDVTGKCQPIVDGVKITPRTSFSSLMKKAELFSSCIGGDCGNAADPTIDLLSSGTHINQFIDVKYQGRYSDVTSKAIDQWASAIKRQHGLSDDDYDNIDFEWFNCISNAPADVVSTMRQEVVTAVWIGRDLNEHCSR